MPTDYAKACHAAMAQFRLLAASASALGAEQYARPTRLGNWSVAELVAHLAANIDAVTRALDAEPPAKVETDLFGYLGGMREHAPGVAERAHELASGRAPEELAAAFRQSVDAAGHALVHAGADAGPRLVRVRLGAVTLHDFLITRCLEGVVHGLDLCAAIDHPPAYDPDALRVVVRTLAMLLADRVPGRAVEVRIPGPAGTAVQCVEGPRHTRGTPGNVVEADPVAFVEVTTGRLGWADAVADGRVRASGDRADLAPYLPLLA